MSGLAPGRTENGELVEGAGTTAPIEIDLPRRSSTAFLVFALANTKNEMPSGSSGEVIGIRGGDGANQPRNANQLAKTKVLYLKYPSTTRQTVTPTASQALRAPRELLCWMNLATTPAKTEIPIRSGRNVQFQKP